MHALRISNEGELYQNHRSDIDLMYFADSACYWGFRSNHKIAY